MDRIKEKLLPMKDEKYKEFQCALMPTVNKDRVIGVRTPALRKLSKEMTKNGEAQDFMKCLPHEYYEENNLHVFLIQQIRDFDLCIKETDRFLPFIDNWATCDSLRPTCFKSNKEKLLPKIEEWMNSKHPYTIRFGIEMLMIHILEDDRFYRKQQLERCAKIESDEYYVNMMTAWFFATALAFRYADAVKFFKERRLSRFVHSAALKKALESYRINEEQKAELKCLR